MVLNVDPEWVKVFKEKCEINNLYDLNTMPTVTVMAKWFQVDKLARLSASKLVQNFFYIIILTHAQIGPLYEKLKDRLYNSFYRRQKRLEARYKGDLLKMREELGVEIPLRAKRPRKSKEASTSTKSDVTGDTPQNGDAPQSETLSKTMSTTANVNTNSDGNVQAEFIAAANTTPYLEKHSDSSLPATTSNVSTGIETDLRPEGSTTASAVLVPSGVNTINSVAGSEKGSVGENKPCPADVSMFFTASNSNSSTHDTQVNTGKYPFIEMLQSYAWFYSECFSRGKGAVQRFV